jgi:hypothetical protein
LRRGRKRGFEPQAVDVEKRYVRKLQEEIWSYYQAELSDQVA